MPQALTLLELHRNFLVHLYPSHHSNNLTYLPEDQLKYIGIHCDGPEPDLDL